MSLHPAIPKVSRFARRVKEGRIRTGFEFELVVQHGFRLPERRVVVYVRPCGPTTRAGFICARHVGGAVVRSRARRVLREAWRHVAPLVPVGYDIVFMARPEIREAKTHELVEEMTRALAAGRVIAR